MTQAGKNGEEERQKEKLGGSKPNKFYSEQDIISFVLASFDMRASPVAREWNHFLERFVLSLENRIG